MHHVVSKLLCLHARATLRKSIHREEISDFLLAVLYNVSPNNIFFREQEVDDIVLRHLVVHLVFLLLLVEEL